MPFTTVLSDLDGTLVDTSEDVLLAFARAFEENNLGSFPFNRSCIGPKAIEIIRAALPTQHDDICHRVLRSFRQHHDSSDLSNSKLFEGVEETILKLKTAGIDFYVVTNKPKSGVLNCINRLHLPLGIEDCFSVGDFGTSNKSELVAEVLNQKNLEAHSAIMVGDTREDILSAQDSAIMAVYCSYGFGSHGVVENKAHARIENFSQLLHFICA